MFRTRKGYQSHRRYQKIDWGLTILIKIMTVKSPTLSRITYIIPFQNRYHKLETIKIDTLANHFNCHSKSCDIIYYQNLTILSILLAGLFWLQYVVKVNTTPLKKTFLVSKIVNLPSFTNSRFNLGEKNSVVRTQSLFSDSCEPLFLIFILTESQKGSVVGNPPT